MTSSRSAPVTTTPSLRAGDAASASRSSASAALVSTSSGNLADLDFGMPELLTRVRAAVLPIAAYTMRRRPGFAERTRRLAADVVSAATWSLSFASTDVDPRLGSLASFGEMVTALHAAGLPAEAAVAAASPSMS